MLTGELASSGLLFLALAFSANASQIAEFLLPELTCLINCEAAFYSVGGWSHSCVTLDGSD